MTSRENLAVQRLLALLENRYAMRVLWALRDGHRQTFRLLQDSVGGITPNTLNTRLKELRQAGFVEHGRGGGNSGDGEEGESIGYGATESGRDLLRRLSDLHPFAGRWVASQAALPRD